VIVARAASSGCRAPDGKMYRSADLDCARLFRGESGSPLSNQRRPKSFPQKLAERQRPQSFLESVSYGHAEKAWASPLLAFATPDASAMLKSYPFQPPASRQGRRLRRGPMRSNAQVPANWAFLQILAQSRKTRETAPMEAVGSTIAGGRESKMEILIK
jgi:hypothetical protein